ncbi:pinopsin-like [Lepeophtheirus salmonis]|uniref:pinopsin-like n=1 Tax=Lepeophtheirus salmonis TaxID=72036 RepID=UPI001AE2779E|nr:pinopsin-like [Lepeophtheirus salmonis]
MSNTSKTTLDWSAYESPPISPILYGCACVYLSIIGVIGILINSFVIYAFSQIKRVRNPFNLLVLNLIVTEFLVSLFGIPIDFLSSFNRGWKFGRFFCQIVGFVLTYLGICSVYTLTVLAFFRCCILFISNYSLSFKQAIQSIVFIWVSTFLIAAPPLLGWGEYTPEKSGMSCAPNWETPTSLSYVIYLFVSGFFLPVIVIMYCNTKVVLFLRRNTESKAMNSTRGVAKRHERNSTIILLSMTTAFFICWLPYTICSLYVVFGGSAPPWLSAIPLQFAKSSTCVSPIIYVFYNQEFRTNVIKYFQKNTFAVERTSIGPSSEKLDTKILVTTC